MKRPNRFTKASLWPKLGVGVATLVCAAQASQPPSPVASLVPAASEITLSVIWQRTIDVAQVNEPTSRGKADLSSPAQQEFANLGQLLDAGGKLLSPQEFKEELAQRTLVGMMPSGASIEVMYTSSGLLAGSLLRSGSTPRSRYSAPQNWPLSGSWKIDDSERICTSMRINDSQGASIMPAQCQFWFKFGDRYYVCDSDEDRSAKLLVRILK